MQQDDEYSFYPASLPEWGIDSILVAEDCLGNQLFQFRPMCDALQLQRSGQNAFIQTDSRTRKWAKTIKAPTDGGRQSTLFLRKRETAIWLTCIDPEKVNGVAKGRLDEFQAGLWNVAERAVFNKRRSVHAGAEDIGEVMQVTGTEHAQIDCECGRRHILEKRDGVWRVWHLEPEQVN